MPRPGLPSPVVGRGAGGEGLSLPPRRKRRKSFVEHTLTTLSTALEGALDAEATAARPGLLQQLDPRVKVVGLLALVVTVALARSFFVILGLFAVAIVLGIGSRISMRTLATRAWLGVLVFTGCIALPAIFITPGRAVTHLPLLGWPITVTGLRSALYLITRVETAATMSLLLILCTPWTHVLKALRVLHVPVVFVVILGMTYRYIFLMLHTARDMFESRQSRMVGTLDPVERRRIAAASVGVLLDKSFQLSGEVYLAMQSRGFRGEVHTLDDFVMQSRDWLAAAAFVSTALVAWWFGR